MMRFGKIMYDVSMLRNFLPIPMPVATTAPNPLMHAVKA